MGIFKYKEQGFYARFFDGSEEGTFEVPSGHTKVGLIIKSAPGDPKLYVLR